MEESNLSSSTSTDGESTDYEASAKKKKKPWKRNEPLVNTDLKSIS